MYNNRLKDRTQ